MAGINVGSATATILVDAKQALAAIEQVQQSFGGLQKSTGPGAFRQVAGGLGAAVAGMFGQAISSAVSFEHAMDGAAASLGGVDTAVGVTSDQFAQLRDEVLRLGADTSKSAGEAAQAVDLLAKAGLSYETIISGALEASINLSEATGESLASSATAVASTMLLYQSQGLEAAAATDIWTVAMNSSNASMSEMQTGLNNLAPIVAQTGQSFEESAALIAFFNSQGLDAASVGTGLTRAYIDMTTATGDAAEEMARLGIEVFDTKGEFIGFPAIFDQWSAATKNMTEEERARSTSLIFSAAAMDVMSLAAQSGGDPVRALTGEMLEGGAAAESAAQRMDNAAGAIERMTGAFESLFIDLGSRLLPVVEAGANAVAALVEAFSGLPDVVKTVTMAFAGLFAVWGTLTTGGALASMIPGFSALGATLAALAGPITLVIGLAGLLGVAFAKNFGGVRDWTNGVIQSIRDIAGWWNVLTDGFAGDELRAQFGGIATPVEGLEATFAALGRAIYEVTGIDVRGWLTGVGKSVLRMPRAFQKFERQLKQLDRIFRRSGFRDGLEALFGDEGRDLLEAFGDGLSALPKLAGEMLRGITTPFASVNAILGNLGSTLITAGRLVQEVFQGDFAGAGEVLDRLTQQLLRLGDSILDGVIAGLRAVPWASVWAAVVSLLVGAAGALGAVLNALGGALLTVASGILNGIISGVQNTDWSAVWTEVTTFVGNAIPAVLDTGKEIALSFLAKLADGIFPGGFTNWIQSQLGYGPEAPDGTGGPNGTTGGIPMGELLLAYAGKLAGQVLEIAADVGSWVKEQAPGLLNATVTGLTAALSFVARLAGSLFGFGKDAAGWLADQIGRVVTVENLTAALGFVARLAGSIFGAGRDGAGWLADQVGRVVNVENLTAALSFAAQLVGSIFGLGKTAASWLADKVGRVVNVPNLRAALNFVAELAGDIWGEVSGAAAWLKGQIDPEGDGITVPDIVAYIEGTIEAGAGFKVSDVVNFIKDLWEVSPETEAAMKTAGEDIGEKVGGFIIDGISAFFSGGGDGESVPAFGGAEQIAQFLDPNSGTLMTAIDAFAAGLVGGLWDAIEAAWGPFIANWANRVLDIYNTLADAANLIPGVDLPKYKVEIDEEGNVALVQDHGNDLGTILSSEMSAAYESAWHQEFVKAMVDGDLSLQDLNALQDIEAQAQAAGAAFAVTAEEMRSLTAAAADFERWTSGGTVDPSGSPVNAEDIDQSTIGTQDRRVKVTVEADTSKADGALAGLGQKLTNFGRDAKPMTLPAPDGRNIDTALSGLTTKLSTFGRDTPPLKLPAADTSEVTRSLDVVRTRLKDSTGLGKMKIDADNSPAIAAFSVVTKAAAAWNVLRATAKLDGDNSPFIAALATVTKGAAAWNALTATATLAANVAPALASMATAFGRGQSWAGTTFTARFSVDLSPLEAAVGRVRQIAAEISALLPSSPAKKGPLARKISFGYVADALRSAMDQMGPEALAGVTAAQRAFDQRLALGLLHQQYQQAMMARSLASMPLGGYAAGRTMVIDNRRYEYVTLTNSEMARLLAEQEASRAFRNEWDEELDRD